MRHVRDYDAELKVLSARARALKARKVEQLGSLVVATGADGFDVATLTGILLAAVASRDAAAKEAWASKGAAFFQRQTRKASGAVDGDRSGAGPDHGGDPAG